MDQGGEQVPVPRDRAQHLPTLRPGGLSKAESYWEATSEFWQQVRTEWRKALREHEVISYKKEVEGSSLIRSTFSLAKKVQKGEPLKQGAVQDLVKSFTE